MNEQKQPDTEVCLICGFEKEKANENKRKNCGNTEFIKAIAA